MTTHPTPRIINPRPNLSVRQSDFPCKPNNRGVNLRIATFLGKHDGR